MVPGNDRAVPLPMASEHVLRRKRRVEQIPQAWFSWRASCSALSLSQCSGGGRWPGGPSRPFTAAGPPGVSCSQAAGSGQPASPSHCAVVPLLHSSVGLLAAANTIQEVLHVFVPRALHDNIVIRSLAVRGQEAVPVSEDMKPSTRADKDNVFTFARHCVCETAFECNADLLGIFEH